MGKKEEKTNVMRVLDSLKLSYEHREYKKDPKLTGADVAHSLGENADAVFKTLVTVSKSKKYYVFMIPVERELDLKRAARAVGEKKHRYDCAERAATPDRVCSRRLLSDRNEKTISHHSARKRAWL